jgi:hypothetical protein
MKRNFGRVAAAGIGLAALAVFTGPGCMGYRLGSSLPANIRTLRVPVFENRSEEPLIEADLTREVIGAIQRDATFQVVRGTQPADAELKVTLRKFLMAPVAYDGGRDSRADTYRLTIIASYTLTHEATGQVLSQHARVYGQAIVPIVGDITSSKLAALPEASQELARDIVDKITETWQ